LDDLTPEKYSSALSRLVFAWLDPLVAKGWKKQLDRSDLWSLQQENRWKKKWKRTNKFRLLESRQRKRMKTWIEIKLKSSLYFKSDLQPWFQPGIWIGNTRKRRRTPNQKNSQFCQSWSGFILRTVILFDTSIKTHLKALWDFTKKIALKGQIVQISLTNWICLAANKIWRKKELTFS
jgi:hypothetical protein